MKCAPTLLPFAPILKGGDNPLVIRKALARLREDEQLADMEALLAFFATFVMTPEEVLRLMRWDMTMLRESPWYSEIEEEAALSTLPYEAVGMDRSNGTAT